MTLVGLAGPVLAVGTRASSWRPRRSGRSRGRPRGRPRARRRPACLTAPRAAPRGLACRRSSRSAAARRRGSRTCCRGRAASSKPTPPPAPQAAGARSKRGSVEQPVGRPLERCGGRRDGLEPARRGRHARSAASEGAARARAWRCAPACGVPGPRPQVSRERSRILPMGRMAPMRIGIVAYWFNRGQAVVARQIRSALDELGHETFVLARPTRKTNIRPDWIDREGVWAQEGVTAASDYLDPLGGVRGLGRDDPRPTSSCSTRTTSSTRSRSYGGPACGRSGGSSGSTSPTSTSSPPARPSTGSTR